MSERYTIYVCSTCGKRDEYGIAGRLPDHTRCPCGGRIEAVECWSVDARDIERGEELAREHGWE